MGRSQDAQDQSRDHPGLAQGRELGRRDAERNASTVRERRVESRLGAPRTSTDGSPARAAAGTPGSRRARSAPRRRRGAGPRERRTSPTGRGCGWIRPSRSIVRTPGCSRAARATRRRSAASGSDRWSTSVQYANIEGAASLAWSFLASTSAMWATRSASIRRESFSRSTRRRRNSSSETVFRL